VEVKIGIQSVPRELVVEKGGQSVFAIAVAKGGKVLVPADKIAYVEFVGAEARRVGFGNV